MNARNTKEPPDLAPASKGPTPIEPKLNLPNESGMPTPSKNLEVFINPNPPPTPPDDSEEEEVEGRIINEGSTKKLRKIPYKIIAGILVVILLVIVGFTVNELFLNRITTLSLIPDDTEYYLTFSVNEHPQAKKAKELLLKFPGGEKALGRFDDYYSEFAGKNNPLEDILRLSKEELFFAKLRPTESGDKSYGSLNTLLNIVELPRPKDARGELEKFRKDPDIYDISDEPYEGQNIMNIRLKEKSSSAQRSFSYGSSKFGLPTPKGIYATPVKNFIVASEKAAAVKKSIDLAKVKSLFGFKNSDLKNLQDNPDHKEIAKYFPKETLVKFYQNLPLSPYDNFLPSQSLSQPLMASPDRYGGAGEKSDTYTRIPVGFTATAQDDGLNIATFQVDIKNPDEGLKNPFKIEDSLASRLPQKFSGISPAIYGETRNYYQAYQDQIDQIKDLAENSDNRNQRKTSEEALKFLEEARSEFRKTTGIDYEKDFLVYLDSQVAAIFNAGSAKKSPEFLFVADIKDPKKVEASLSKIKIPNYLKEYELSMQDSTRRTNLYSIGDAISRYLTDNSKVPSSLADLTPKYIAKVPKDPATKKTYKYTPSSDLKSAQVEAKLSDGRSAYWSSDVKYMRHKGVAKKVTVPRLTPKRGIYKNVNVYSMDLYKYGNFSLGMYFSVTDRKLIILFGDTNQSLREIIDFEVKPEKAISSGEGWKTQFSEKVLIGGLSYIEPIKFWGIADYVTSQYPKYKQYTTNDLKLTIRGYLKTIKTIGTVIDKNGPVHTSKTFINIVELPSAEKDKVEEALIRLIDQDRKSGYTSVLGMETSTNTLELWKEKLKRLFVPSANQ